MDMMAIPEYLCLQFVVAYAQSQTIMLLAIFLSVIIPSGKTTLNITLSTLLFGVLFLQEPCVNTEGKYRDKLDFILPIITVLTPVNGPAIAFY